jgi:glycopeptide antibiotics resistance protein
MISNNIDAVILNYVGAKIEYIIRKKFHLEFQHTLSVLINTRVCNAFSSILG